MTERIVTYRLKVIEFPGNQTAIDKMAKRMVDAEKSATLARIRFNQIATDEIEKLYTRMNSSILTGHQRTTKDMEKRTVATLKISGDAAKKQATLIEDANRRAITAIDSAASKAEARAKKANEKPAYSDMGPVVQLEKERRKLEELDKKYAEAGKSIQGEIEGWTGAVTQFGRGIAGLGILSQGSTEKIVRGLVVAQGAFDTINGAVKTYLMLNTSMQRILEMRRIAEERVAAQSALNTVALRAETVQTNLLASARANSLVGAGVGSVGTGLSTATGKAVGSGVGTAATGGTAGFAGSKLAGFGAASAGTIAAYVGAVGGSLFALVSALDTAAESLSNGIFGGAKPGSMTDTIAGSLYNPVGWMVAPDVRMQQINTGRNAGIAEANASYSSIYNDNNRGLALINGASRLRSIQQSLAMMESGPGSSLEDQLGTNNYQLAFLRGTRDSVSQIAGQGGPGNEAEIAKMRLQMGEQELSLLKEHYSLNHQIGEEKLRFAKEGINLAKQALETAKQELAVDEEKLMSAKERFGNLSEFDQKRLIDIKRRADAGEKLINEERSLLRGVGTEGAIGIARKQDLAAADAAGFDTVFGQTERTRIAAQRRVIEERLEVELKQATEVEVKVTQDNEKIFQEVRKAIREAQVNLQPILQQIAQEETNNQIASLREEIDRRLAAYNAAYPRNGR